MRFLPDGGILLITQLHIFVDNLMIFMNKSILFVLIILYILNTCQNGVIYFKRLVLCLLICLIFLRSKWYYRYGTAVIFDASDIDIMILQVICRYQYQDYASDICIYIAFILFAYFGILSLCLTIWEIVMFCVRSYVAPASSGILCFCSGFLAYFKSPIEQGNSLKEEIVRIYSMD